jgi:hypothetical protein
MSLPATDSFNRADGGVGANWTALQNNAAAANGHEIVSNECRAVQGTGSYAYSVWNADVFDADHYAQIKDVNAQPYAGPLVRGNASGPADCYVFFNNLGSESRLYRADDGFFTLLQSGMSVPAAGSIVKLTAESSSLKLYDDGVQIGATATDATYGTGRAGIFAYNDGSGVGATGRLDDWEGGNMVVAPVRRWILGAH